MTPGLQLPPPPFPVQFKSESPAEHSIRKPSVGEWPGERPRAPHGTGGALEWSLKTDGEAYVSSLGPHSLNLLDVACLC